MPRILSTDAYPIGAGMAQPPERWDEICELVNNTPKTIRTMLGSPHTAAFIRGLVKIHNLPLSQGLPIAYAVLQVALGEKTLAQLAGMLSSDLQIANDKAQTMAQDIERELFVPMMLEYNQFIQTKKMRLTRSTGGARNILDLKSQSLPRPTPPRPIPSKPLRFT